MDSDNTSIYLPRMARILRSVSLTLRERLFELRLEGGARLSHMPGQFVELGVLGAGEAPISVSSSPTRAGDTFEVVVRNVGSVTGALHALPVGAEVGIRGPFGQGFPVQTLKGLDVLFAAGGLGIVPLRSMIDYALDNREEFGRLTLLYGARTPADMLFTEEAARWEKGGLEILTTVDLADGAWTGNVGPITGLFGRAGINPAAAAALLVGPPVMYRFVLAKVTALGIPDSRVFLSLERRMKCGVGKCGHCQVDDVYACIKGPVFPYTRLKKLKEAL